MDAKKEVNKETDLPVHRNPLEGGENINLWGLSLVAEEKNRHIALHIR